MGDPGIARSRRRSIALAILLNFLLVQTVPLSTPAQSRPDRASASEDWAAAAQRAAADSEYEITGPPAALQAGKGAYQAPNRAHNFRTWFADEGVRIVPRTAEGPQWDLSISLVGYGRGADVRRVDPPALDPQRNRIDYRRGGLIEWYVNDDRGLEQGFTLPAPPENLPAGPAGRSAPGRRGTVVDTSGTTDPAFVVLRIGGDLFPTVAADGQAVEFVAERGGLTVVRYGDLKVFDVLGRELPAWMEGFAAEGIRGIRLLFDDTDAVYPVTIDPLATGASWTGEADQEGAGFGWSVASAGDVNGDGYGDVIVGAPYFDANGDASGRAFIYYGSPSGLPAAPGVTFSGEGPGALLGSSVAAAGNVNGLEDGRCVGGGSPGAACTDQAQCFPGTCAGYDDVLVGAPGFALVQVRYGGPGGPVGPYKALQDAPTTSLGHSVASAGDINRDGYGDIVIGAPFYDCPGMPNCGKVQVHYGSPTGPGVAPGWTIEGDAAGAQLGWTVAAGDVTGTSDPDLIVSAPGPPTGRAYVYPGSAAGPSSSAAWSATFTAKRDLRVCSVTQTQSCAVDSDCAIPQCWSCMSGETCSATNVNPYQPPYNRSTLRNSAVASGGTLVAATGDVNGDGRGDWIVGSPYYDDPNQAGVDEGRVDVYYGATILNPTQAASWSSIGKPGSFFGWSVAGAGDTNADGVADVLVGAKGADNPATDEGRASVFLGSTAGPTSEPTWTVEGEQYYAALGFSVASAGDVNGDGSDDVVVGAPNAQRGQFLEGIATVHQGSAGLTPLVVGDALGFTVYYTRAELQDFVRGVLSPQLASAAVGFGPVPGSILLSTGRASDGGLGDTDWGEPGSPDKTVFELRAPVPPQKKSFCFSSQFITSETDPGLDKAFFCHDREGGACSSPVHDLSALATGRRNAPVGHCFDVDGKTSLFLHFEVTDGGGNGANDSAVILSRIYFSDLPLPPDAMPETTADGYFQNPAPLDVSRLAGTYSFTKSLLSVPGVTAPFDLTVYYDSAATSEGALGPKWSHSYEASAQRLFDGDGSGLPDSIRVRVGSVAEYFKETPQGRYEPRFGGGFSSLTYDPNAATPSITYVTQDRRTHVFDERVVDPLRAPEYHELLLTSITDLNGGEIHLGYDPSDHRLTGVTDTRGELFTFQYAAGGRLSAVHSNPGAPKQARVTFEHDAGTGVLEAFTEADGRKTTFTSTADGRILTVTNADGVVFSSNTYEQFSSIAVDQQGDRIVSRRDGRDQDPLDPREGMTFSYEGDSLVSIDRLNPPRLESRVYDAKGRIAAEIDRTGARMEYDYDRNNRRIETRRKLPSEAAARVIEQSAYDSRGNLTRRVEFPGVCISDPDAPCTVDSQCPGSTCGVVSIATSDQDDNLRSMVDHHGNRSTLDYDAAGNLIRERDPLGHEITHTYGSVPGSSVIAPGPISTTNARGFTSFKEFDVSGNLIRATDPLGRTTTYAWDSLGRRISTTDPLGEMDPSGGHRVCTDYDDAGRPVRVRVMCGTPSEFTRRSVTYDAEGRIVSQTEADGAVSRILYTKTGQVQEEIDPLGQSVLNTYDLADRLIETSSPSPSARGGSTGGLRVESRRGYDDGDRLTSLTESSGRCVGGDPVSSGQACADDTDCPGGGRCGVSSSAGYDEIGRLVRVTDPGGKVRRFESDAMGRLVASGEDSDNDGGIDPSFRESLTYDGRGLPTSLTTPRGHTISYSYDAAGRKTGLAFGGSSISHVLDANGNRVLSVFDGAAVTRAFDPLDHLTGRIDEFGNRVDTIRDAAGRVTGVVYPSDLDGDGQRDQVIYEYDSLHRLTGVFSDWDGRRATYGYDLVGRLTRATLPDGSIVTYDYDAAGRLTGIADLQGGFTATYRLNGAGVRTEATVRLPLDPVLPADDVTYTYGPRNELLSSSAGASFTYDESGNMVTGTIGGSPVALVHNEIGELTSVGSAIYRYDADGPRIETDRNGTIRRYVYDMAYAYPRVLEEQDAAGNVVSRYVHGLGLISRTGPEGFRVYHYDSRGSTVSLTDGTGAITDRYAYDPFGRLAGHAGGTVQPFRYNGRDGVHDDDNGLYYMRSRYYAPELQRFVQMDQAFQGELNDSQSLNRYAFVTGDPIQRIDPGGAWGWVAFTALAGAATNVAISCWDGCSASEAAGAAVEGFVAGVIVGVNPLVTLAGAVKIGAAAGVVGAVAGWGTQKLAAEIADETQPTIGDLALRVVSGALGGAAGGLIGGASGGAGATALSRFSSATAAAQTRIVGVHSKLLRQGATRALTSGGVGAALKSGVRKIAALPVEFGVSQGFDELFPPSPNADASVLNTPASIRGVYNWAKR